MDILLNENEVRVLGCLIEKEATTPDYYPMTLNGLQNACNQKSNRKPVMDISEKEIVIALDSLRDKKLASMISKAGSRVPKYEHKIEEALDISPQEIALICVLLLRGSQTTGELRQRCSRIFDFDNVQYVEKVLGWLIEREMPLAIKLERQPGRKEHRYTHLLAGEIEETTTNPAEFAEKVRKTVEEEKEKQQYLETTICALRDEVCELREELQTLRDEFSTFKTQFE